MRDEPALLMFFYGTLKRGHSNHEAFCRGARFVGQARLRGNLYDLPYGYPALTVPPEEILVVGTADPAADAAIQRRLGPVKVLLTDGPRQRRCPGLGLRGRGGLRRPPAGR